MKSCIFPNFLQARSPTELNFTMESTKKQRELVKQLEAKNRYDIYSFHFRQQVGSIINELTSRSSAFVIISILDHIYRDHLHL